MLVVSLGDRVTNCATDFVICYSGSEIQEASDGGTFIIIIIIVVLKVINEV